MSIQPSLGAMPAIASAASAVTALVESHRPVEVVAVAGRIAPLTARAVQSSPCCAPIVETVAMSACNDFAPQHARPCTAPARPSGRWTGPWGRRARAALLAAGATGVIGVACGPTAAAEIELLHMWTSEGENRAVQTLPPQLAAQGITLKLTAVPGGPDALTQALRERMQANKAPGAVLMKAVDLTTWGDQGALASLDALAQKQEWSYKIPGQIGDQIKYKGSYVAIPVNVHRVDQLFINRQLLQQVQGRAPQSWPQFFQLAERLQKAGITPLAQGDEPWQNLTLFEIIVLSQGGAEFYRRAMVQRDPGAIAGPVMTNAMQTFVALKPLTGPAPAAGSNQSWGSATARVISGKAAMQFMGDWAKGDFLAAKKFPDKDFLCASPPGGYGNYMYVLDSLAVFRQGPGREATPEQMALANAVMGVDFQATFSLAKGSIPVTPGTDMTHFDSCAQESSAFFMAARLLNTLVPSVAHRMALPAAPHKALEALIDRLWNDANYTPALAQRDWTAQVRPPAK